MKKNKKKMIIVILVIVLLLIIGLVLFFIINNTPSVGQIEQQVTDPSTGEVIEYQYSIKNAAEKDGIKATNINFHVIGDQLEVVTTLQNNTNEQLNGYYIEIELLDKDDNVLTTIADNSTEKIEAGQSKEIINYVMDIEKPDKVSKAKITTLEKSNIAESMEQNFDSMIPEDAQEQVQDEAQVEVPEEVQDESAE